MSDGKIIKLKPQQLKIRGETCTAKIGMALLRQGIVNSSDWYEVTLKKVKEPIEEDDF